MYSTKVIERSIAAYEAKAGHQLLRLDIGKRDEWRDHLDQRLSKHDGDADALARDLKQEERLFIRNERVLSMLDFRFWAEGYGTIQKDGGGVCLFRNIWESQRILLDHVAKREEELHEAAIRKEPIDGLLFALHKARQLGATAVGRLLLMHRLTLQNNRRAMSASVDDDKIQELYDRDKLIYDNLPFYLKPTLKYDEKRQHLHFFGNESRSLYQVSSQKSGLGVGRQFDMAHLTELSTWVNGDAIELDFFPTLPQSITTFALLESTAYGRGNFWHDFTERVRRGDTARWRYVFVPWYVEISKYRREPPADWAPSQVSLLHAQKVHDTSPDLVGRTVMLSRQQLYWYETTRTEYQKANNLRYFLTNWPATPEESFQHSSASAFSVELLDELRTRTRAGTPFELVDA